MNYLFFFFFLCLRKRQRRTGKGIYERDRADEGSGKTSECVEFSRLLDHNQATSSHY